MGEGEVCMEVINDGEMQIENSSKRDNKWVAEGNELDNFPNKKQVKEASNDDIFSEVSNPSVSPKEVVSSFQTITSQPIEVASIPVGCGEITSTCSGDSSTDRSESLSDKEHSGIDTPGAVSTSHVVLEIPKHATSTGIRKITFKFSMTKEEYDNREESRSNFAAPHDRSRKMHVSTEGSASLDSSNCGFNTSVMELKMSKKVCADSYPSNVKKLLSTGILEGARVKYISPTREKELCGIVSRDGYLCGCSICNFSKVVSAYEFELHAGGKTRHPNSYIFMENGKPIYSIIQKLRTAPPSALDDVIRDVAGSSVNEESFQYWKASIQESNGMVEDKNDIRLPSLPCSVVSWPAQVLEDGFDATCSSIKKFSRKEHTYMDMCMPEEGRHLVKMPISHSNAYVHKRKTAEGVTRRRDNDLHRLLFKPNGLPDGAELAYYIKGQRILGGYKQGNGIVCSCCDTEISPSQFEAHAGWAARRQPYRHIYISNGLTLHDIAMSLAKGHSLTTGGSDDMCAACGDGGNLILCEGCPRAFHAACLDIQCVPERDWYCSHCRDKFGQNTKAVAGEYSGAARPIIIRLTRVVKAPEPETGGCVVCRANDFSVAIFDERTVIICDQCEKEFHVGCLRDSGLCDLKELPKDKWFCCDDCSKIHVALQNLVFKGAEIIPAASSTIVIRKHTDKGYTYGTSDDIQWRIFSGKSRCPEHLPFLSRAAAIFRECFDPIVASSGRDLIPVMVYGRNISGQEFGGMYCVVLTVKSVVVSAGLLRVFGREVAELPLVATSREYQGKGYFQALFSCIERLLCSLNVENLVLPAAEDAESIWTKKLGFQKMSEDRMSKLTRDLQLTAFKGTSMLEKKMQLMTNSGKLLEDTSEDVKSSH